MFSKKKEEIKTSTMIYVTFQKEGIHHFPGAKDNPKYKDVEFLSHPHRHMFHFKVYMEVFHDDRDVEFIQFKRDLMRLYDKGVLQADNKSVEMLAKELYAYLITKYPGRNIKIDISEDGENGCFVEWVRD